MTDILWFNCCIKQRRSKPHTAKNMLFLFHMSFICIL